MTEVPRLLEDGLTQISQPTLTKGRQLLIKGGIRSR